MKINLIFSMIGPALDDSTKEVFSRVAQWTVLNERNGWILVDAIGNQESVSAAFAALDYMGRDPTEIGMWNEAGEIVPGHPLNKKAWLDVAPDEIVGYEEVDGELSPIFARPTEWKDIHRWAGWAEKTTL